MVERESQVPQGAVPQRRKSDDAGNAVNVRVLAVVAIVLAVALVVVALFTLRSVNEASTQLDKDNTTYTECRKATDDLQIASDYLTSQSRMYVSTGYSIYMTNFVNEVLVNDRRGKAVETLESNMEVEASTELNKALELSNNLVQTELRAIRLAAESYGEKNLPPAVAEVQLSESELAMDKEERLAFAESLVLGNSYEGEKSRINEKVRASANELVQELEIQRERSDERLNGLLVGLRLAVVLLACIVLFVVLVSYVFVLRPISKYIGSIKRGKELVPGGAFELHYLADAYNDMFQENLRRINYFRRAAEHDPLTGLGNRGAYDDFLSSQAQDYALLLVDVDNFKGFNDTYGHDVGDDVLKKVADSLTESFRSTDFPCRIGGDEFAVVMTDITPELRDVIVRKIQRVANALADTSDGVPAVTLSIGVAFSTDATDELDIFKAADNALYIVKERGRNGHAFYGDK